MKNKEKDIYFLKIKQSKSYVKREFHYSDLKDFNLMYEKIINAITYIEKKTVENLNDYSPIIMLNHPEINKIYIYCKDQWDLYYKYNLIEECINNRTIKMELLKFKKEEKLISSSKLIIDNQNKIMKYIIKNIPLDLYLYTLINFFKERQEILKIYISYFINELINNDISLTPNIDDDNFDENININNLINNKESKKYINKKTVNNKNDMESNKQYYLHRKDFISILDERFKTFSKNQKSFEEIKKAFKEKDNPLSDLGIKEDYTYSTSLELKNDQSLEKMSLSNVKAENKNNILFTVLNPPPQYIKNLMNNDKYFNKFNKNEYYMGLEDYKDQLNREYMETLINNSKLNY